MKYRATREGNLGKTVVDIYRDGKHLRDAHILIGDEFEFGGTPGKWMEPIKNIAAPERKEEAEVSRQDAIKELTALDIPFFRGAKTEVLVNLLKEPKK